MQTRRAQIWHRFGLPFGKRRRHRVPRTPQRFRAEQLEPRRLLAADLSNFWHNPYVPADVNSDDQVSPLDALLVINALNSQGPGLLRPPLASDAEGERSDPYLDVNNDGHLSPLDALKVINELNAEGEPTIDVEATLQIRSIEGDIIDTVSVGDSFIVNMRMKDVRDPLPDGVTEGGVFAAYTDISYDSNIARAQWTEIQELVLPTEAVGGTYTLTFDGQETDELDADADSDDIRKELEDLPSIGDGGVIVEQLTTKKFQVTFRGDLAETNVPLLTGDGSNLLDDDDIPLPPAEAVITVTNVAGLDTNPATEDYVYHSEIFNNTRHESVIENAGAGLFDNTGGVAGLAQTGQSTLLVFSAQFKAIAPGEITFVSDVADTNTSFAVLIYGLNDEPPADGIDWGTATLTVEAFTDYVANDDTATVAEDSSDTPIDVLGNDTVDVGVTVTIDDTSQPANGTVAITGGGTGLTYRPDPNFAGTDTFTYDISDGVNPASTATVTVTVTDVEDPAVAVDDAFSVDEDSTNNSLDVLANDNAANPDAGEVLTIIDVTTPNQGGSATAVGGTSINYSPAANVTGIETFQYTVSDGTSTATATVTIDIGGQNDPPEANDDTAQVNEDSSVTIDVLANDTDPDPGTTLRLIAVGTPSNGTATIQGNQVLYTPNANFFGNDSFTYTIDDGVPTSEDTATVNVVVAPVNDPAPALDDTYSVDEDSTNNPLDVLTNDNAANVDPGEVLTIIDVTPAANGTVNIAGNVLSYTPTPGYIGPDSFTYTVRDPDGSTATADVTVEVEPGVLPRARTDQATVQEDSADNTIDVLANDLANPGGTLAITGVSDPANGTAVIVGTTVQYTPDADFNGTDTFTYTLADGIGDPVVGTVIVDVTSVNDDPTANDDTAQVAEDGSVPINVLANDSILPDSGETLTVVATTSPSNGSVQITGGGTGVTYTPDADFFGSDTFTYTISDGNGGSDTATVNVTVNPVNDDPTANDDAAQVNEDSSVTIDVLANDTIAPDVNETLSLASVGPAGNGTAAMVGNQVQYTPAADFFGSDSFTYTITDGNGGSDTATVNVTVNPTNDPPTVVDDAVTTVKNTTESFDVLANDLITPDVGETLTIASLGTPSEGGTVAIVGNQIQYTPLPDFIGTETVTYVADDGNGGTDDGVLTITVLDFVPSNVGGMVFDDVNNDGLVDGDGTGRERGIAGIEIRLFGTDDFGDPVDMTTMTGPDGSYEFDRLPPGTYTLQQGPVPFMQDGIDTPGVGGTIADNDTFTIQLDQDTDAIGYNFGELGLQPQYIDIRDIMHSTPDEGVLLAVDEAGGMLWYTLLDGWGDYSGMTAELSDDMSELHIQAVDGAMGDLDLVLPVDNARYVQERGDIGEAHLLRILGSPADLIAALDAAMAEA